MQGLWGLIYLQDDSRCAVLASIPGVPWLGFGALSGFGNLEPAIVLQSSEVICEGSSRFRGSSCLPNLYSIMSIKMGG